MNVQLKYTNLSLLAKIIDCPLKSSHFLMLLMSFVLGMWQEVLVIVVTKVNAVELVGEKDDIFYS